MNYVILNIKNTTNLRRETPQTILKIKKCIFLYESILLLNLYQTAYFDGLTLSDDRTLYGDSTGLNIIFIRAIGCSAMPGEGAI